MQVFILQKYNFNNYHSGNPQLKKVYIMLVCCDTEKEHMLGYK